MSNENKRPLIYVGSPLPQLLKRLGRAIERGEIQTRQVITGMDEVGLPFVKVIPL